MRAGDVRVPCKRALPKHLEANDVGVFEGLEDVHLLHDEVEPLLGFHARQRDGLHRVLGSRLPIPNGLHHSESPGFLGLLPFPKSRQDSNNYLV